MDSLTLAQRRMIADLKYGVDVYVFNNDSGYTFSYYKDNTCARVYTTATAKSLISKGICEVELCAVEGSLDNCVGVLRVAEER